MGAQRRTQKWWRTDSRGTRRDPQNQKRGNAQKGTHGCATILRSALRPGPPTMDDADGAREPFHGERACMREGCSNGAYYVVGALLLCGVHSKRDTQRRRPLAREPAQAKRARLTSRFEAFRVSIVPAPTAASAARGHVRLCRMVGRGKQVPLTAPWLNIMPNNWHTSRSDGLGMPALSPMRLGPVAHGQPGLPDALSIENYHQFNKVFWRELAAAPAEGPLVPTLACPDDWPAPGSAFYATRACGYTDATPHRHKIPIAERGRELALAAREGVSRNTPCYSVVACVGGGERRFTYVQSRFFYCVAYEALAPARPEFAELLGLLARGVSLQICGYDGYDIGMDPDADVLYTHYCDAALPFGHERVLAALLILHGRPRAELPWHRFRTAHPAVYTGVPHAALA